MDDFIRFMPIDFICKASCMELVINPNICSTLALVLDFLLFDSFCILARGLPL